MTEQRTCTTCHSTLPITEFHLRSDGPGGRRLDCAECGRRRARKYYRSPAGRAKHDAWRQAHKDRAKGYDLACRLRNPSRRRAENKARWALSVGKIEVAAECADCDAIDVELEMHHEDYSLPLIIEWLCKPCHGARHRKPHVPARG